MRRHGRWIAITLALLLTWLPGPAAALQLIRDAEIERMLRNLSAPVFEAAGMRPSSVNVFIVNDRSLNAFVAGGQNMFLHTGLLTELETPEEVIGVIAHETGHLAGGHQARRSVALRSAQGPALVAMLAGILAGVAGGPEAGAAISAGTQGALQRTLLSYNRGEEASADQAALRYLERIGVPPDGLVKVLQRFRGQEVFSVGNLDPYVLTHPLSTQRLQLLERHVAEAEGGERPADPEREYWFGRMQAKLSGFLDRPERVLNDPKWQGDGEVALYARAIALHRQPSPREAEAAMERLLAMRPGDPFYLEVMGQILHESGRAEEAVPYYRRAVAAAPDQPLLKAGLGRALLALDTPEADREALAVLKQARAADRGDTAALRDLATAYNRAGDTGMATLATAERFALAGRTDDAVLHARRASELLPHGSPGWLRAQDILALERTRE